VNPGEEQHGHANGKRRWGSKVILGLMDEAKAALNIDCYFERSCKGHSFSTRRSGTFCTTEEPATVRGAEVRVLEGSCA